MVLGTPALESAPLVDPGGSEDRAEIGHLQDNNAALVPRIGRFDGEIPLPDQVPSICHDVTTFA